MPRYDQPQYERMTAAEINDYINTDQGDRYSDNFPDPHGWDHAIFEVKSAAENRRRAVRDDDSWVSARSEEDFWGVVGFLRDHAPGAEWTAAEFTAIGTGDSTTTGRLADVVTGYLQWRDTD